MRAHGGLHPPPPGPYETPGEVLFASAFTATDDNYATGGVVHEVLYWSGCAVFDGLTYGDKDGLLSDESLRLGKNLGCRARQICGRSKWRNPVLRVEATDCAGNVGAAEWRVPGFVSVSDADCGGDAVPFGGSRMTPYRE